MLAPQIAGFTVRAVRLEDAQAWADYAVLPVVKEHTSSTATTVGEVQALIQRVLAGEPTSPIHFVLFPDGCETLVATVGFHTISAVNSTAEITYDVRPSDWGKGIATAACLAATNWGFSAKGWNRVQATTVLTNMRSQRVLERCGFQREGLLRNFRIVRGLPADYLVYSAIPGDVSGAA